MSKIKKIITSSVLAALLVENTFVVSVFAADSVSGTFKMYNSSGDYVGKWTYADSKLTLEGNGTNMAVFDNQSDEPWAPYISDIKEINFIKIGSISDGAFKNYSSLEKIGLDQYTWYIRPSAFENCDSLEKVSLPKNLQTVHSKAFAECDNLKDVYFTSEAKFYQASFGKNTKLHYPTDNEQYQDALKWGLNIELSSSEDSVYPLEAATISVDCGSDGKLRYTGNKIEPKVTLKKANGDIIPASEYNVTYADNIDAGTASVKVTAKGSNVSGQTSDTFTIYPCQLSIDAAKLEKTSYAYTGAEIKPAFTTNLPSGSYTVSYKDNVSGNSEGYGSFIITGCGNYCGSVIYKFRITNTQKPDIIDLSDYAINLSGEWTYTGNEIKPEIVVKGVDKSNYDISYSNNINVGTATVMVTGKNNAKGNVSATYKIKARDISSCSIDVKAPEESGNVIDKPFAHITYNGKELVENEDYILSSTYNKDTGAWNVKVSGIGNFTGSTQKTTRIPLDMVATMNIDKNSFVYDGTAKTPAITVKKGNTALKEGVDYTVTYRNNINAGTADLAVNGIGKYFGGWAQCYNIEKRPIGDCNISLPTSVAYKGVPVHSIDKVTLNGVSLTKGVDYTATYTNNDSIGTMTVIFEGKGNYSGTFKAFVNLTAPSISTANVTLSSSTYEYSGQAQKPNVTVVQDGKSLVNGVDYNVSYKNNKNIGTATVTVTGIGTYAGTVSKTFTINPAKQNIQKLETRYKGFFADWAQKGSATGYEVQYSTNSNFTSSSIRRLSKNKPDYCTVSGITAGKKYYVRVRSYTVVGGKTYYGAWSSANSVTTAKYDFTKASVSGISAKTFTGKAITQKIAVRYNGKTLKSGTDYTVSYSNSKNVGTATVKITGKGSYSGTITKTFKIFPAKQEIKKLSAKSKGFSVTWVKKGSATGYEVQYSTSSSFKNASKATITSKNTSSKTVSKLKSKTKYYVRVRSYTTVKGVKYYGAWSSTKTITTSK